VSRKLNETDVLQAWRDLMTEGQPIVERGGATVPELRRECGLPDTTARAQLRRLCEQGLMRQIGVRPDRNRTAVYQFTAAGLRARRKARANA
jgi:DNA-binding IclR family transcriptional regulator